jgi:hypothetical protein
MPRLTALAGLLTLTSFGVFPISVALGALVVRHRGPTPFFPLAAATTAVAVLAGLSQRAWRDFGASHPTITPNRQTIWKDNPHESAASQ